MSLKRNKCCESFLGQDDAVTSVETAVFLAVIVAAITIGLALLGTRTNERYQGLAGSAATAVATIPAPTKPDALIFSDDFSSKSKSKWRLDGDWQIENGKLAAGPVDGWKEMRAYVKDAKFANGTVSLDARLDRGMGYGLFFHVSGDTTKDKFNGYCFQYDPGYGTGAFVLRKWIDGYEISKPIAVNVPDKDYKWFGVEKHIQVTTVGSNIVATVNGQTVLKASDDSYREGGVGLRLWSNASAEFDNFKVTGG